MKTLLCALIAAAAALAALVVASPGRAIAADDRQVGPFRATVSWQVEPPMVGAVNAIQIRLLRDGAPVPGIDRALKLEATFVVTKRTLELAPVPGAAGVYAAAIIPTRAGEYAFRFFGLLDGTAIDETFASGAGGLATVRSTGDLGFPDSADAYDRLTKMGDEVRLNTQRIPAIQKNAEDTRAESTESRQFAVTSLVLGFITVLIAAVALAVAYYTHPRNP